jgi:signal peptidase I
MLPSLFIGDFILVNKYKYGIRLPVINKKILQMGSPNRGDIMVFRYPHDTSVNYIKRVIGLPGDHILYKDKQVFVNGQPIAQSDASQYTLKETGARFIDAKRFTETIGDVEHDILLDGRKVQPRMEFKVPENSYFVMGDNRDYSNDSRYWGYVSDDLIIGKAFYIWFSLDTENGGGINWDRIGTSIN